MGRSDRPSDPGTSALTELGFAATKEAPAVPAGTVFGPSASDAALGQAPSQPTSSPSSAPLAAGSHIGEYRVVKLLGKGTFGTVYHGAHSVIEKQAALKVLNAQFSDDAKMVQRFVDEARAVNRIAHPNIVDIFGFGQLADGRKYCVMELLQGDTLAQLLERGLPSWPVAAEILRQIAAALDAAHDAGVVHRDLKPDNVFVGGSEAQLRVKLLDFGIAQVADSAHSRTGSGVVLGTPVYMSPEQCRGSRVDRATDVYALGVVAFELFTGKLPFSGDNAMQYIAQHLTAVPPAPSVHNGQLPPAFDQAVLRMLAKSPEQRPARASDAVLDVLQALGIVNGASLRPAVSVAPATTRGLPRWSWPVLAIGALSVVVLGLTRSPGKEHGTLPITKAEPSRRPSTAAAPREVPVAPRPAPAAAPSVVVRVRGEPKDARVFLNGRDVAGLGEALELPRGDQPLELKVQATGFVSKQVVVVPMKDAELEVALKKRKAPAKAANKNEELEY